MAALREALATVLDRIPDDRIEQQLGSGAHDLATLIPGLADRLERLGIEALSPRLDAPDQRGARVRESLFGVIARLAAQNLLVLVVEDLEHSDPGTRGFVSALLRIKRRLPLVVILGYHPDELPRGHPANVLIREIEESPLVERLVLKPLTRDETSALVESLQGERPTLGFVAAVMEGARGNPLLAGQLVAAGAELAGLRLSDPFEEILARTRRPARACLQSGQCVCSPPPEGRSLTPTSVAFDSSTATCRETPPPQRSRAGSPYRPSAASPSSTTSAPRRSRVRCCRASGTRCTRRLAELTQAEPAESAWHWERAARPIQARAAHLAAARAADEVEPTEIALMHYSAALELTESDREADLALLGAPPQMRRPRRSRSGAPPLTSNRHSSRSPAGASNDF